MSASGTDGAEGLAAGILLPLCALSGGVVLSGFFFPEFVGEAVDGAVWLTLALVFFCSGLGYLAVLPHRADAGEQPGEPYLLHVRRTGIRGTLGEFFDHHDPVVFGVPVAVFVAFLCLQVAFPAGTTATVDAVSDAVLREGGPLFQGVVLLSVAYCLFLLVGPWGDVKLGGPDTEPTYTFPTYFTLVFTAGIAAGLVFWGPAEALFHYRDPPPFVGATPGSEAAIGGALTYALFHWGLSAWSAYAVVGVPVAYFVFSQGAPLRVSTILAPFLGVDGLDSRWSTLVDTLAVFATVGGVATSVALVSEQFLAGITFQWGVTAGGVGPVLFVGGLTFIYVLSCLTGVHRGIRRIAGVTVALFALFALALVAVGPRSFVLDRGAAALAGYGVDFLALSLHLDGPWVAEWTVWNWAWWFSWAPFAGLFLAALSRGRRVRTVVFTSVVATSAATATWFLLLGGSSLYVQHTGRADVLAAVAARGGSEAVAGFPLFAALPLGRLLTFLFLALIVGFMVTSADTSTLVTAILATRRGLAPSTGGVVFWGVFQGAVAVSVLVVGGGETLQALAVLTGGPFAVLALVALAGVTLTFARHERGHVSLLRRALARLPAIQLHHDVDPPEKE
ncbi:BCCT family transporter [Halomarina ordinaria]|uniref:BCCT family transporter n=1 Tax=Halomarina ordinaria TaxID=3033939 RepID=A0ABD5UGS1_9EURY|nr:BCCT family transporter [Halomarina sp. PSRA2]